jgi:inosine-uridine nucleoside N-ribohydrolase
MARKVILDVDPGIDDAVAVALALFDPRLDVLAVTATGGNVAPQQATLNIQTIVEQLDPPRLPRLGAAPLDSPLPEDGRQLHGSDGLGNAGFPVAELHNMHPAEKVLCDEVRAAPEEVTIIASGPLTNIDPAMPRSELCLDGRAAGDRRRQRHRAGERHAGGRIQHVLRSAFGAVGAALADDEDPGPVGGHKPICDDL